MSCEGRGARGDESVVSLTGALVVAGDDLRVVTGAALTLQGERILSIGAAPVRARLSLPAS
ncbi:MAG: hypothetical protein IPM07_21605 [Anaerolineales bacterium]|nr:hypothetical protein [Anaerolineales bacterium]